MSKGLTIIDKDYTRWVEDLSVRYRQSQIKAAVRVNQELLKYYWELGRDIEEMHVEERWGQSVIKNLSVDLQLKKKLNRPITYKYLLCKEILFALFSIPKSCPTSCGTIRERESTTSRKRFSRDCPTACGTIGRNAIFHTLGAPPLFDRQIWD